MTKFEKLMLNAQLQTMRVLRNIENKDKKFDAAQAAIERALDDQMRSGVLRSVIAEKQTVKR